MDVDDFKLAREESYPLGKVLRVRKRARRICGGKLVANRRGQIDLVILIRITYYRQNGLEQLDECKSRQRLLLLGAARHLSAADIARYA